MKIQVNSDHNVSTPEGFAIHVEDVIQHVIGRFNDDISRVEVYLSDVNGSKDGNNDKRCVMEARVNGRQPIAVTDTANSLHEVIDGAAEKLKHSLETTLARRHEHRGHTSPDLQA